MRKFRLVLGLVLLASLLLSSFALVGAQDDTYDTVSISIMGQDDIPTLDPSLAEDVSGIQALSMTHPGLTTLNETTVMVEPGIAESWEVSDDGLTYTFNLYEGVPWVHYNAETGAVEQVTDADGNVRYVTVGDVVYGIRRSLNPQTLSYYGGVLATFIAGGADMINLEVAEDGTIDADALATAEEGLAVRAVDEYTVEITAPADFPFLANVYGLWMAAPQPQWAIEEFGDQWTEAANIQSYGPYAVKEWVHDESITLIANPFWTGTPYIPQPQIEEVTNVFLEASAAVANYEAGELLYINPVSVDDVSRVEVEYPNEFGRGPGQCTYYYGFNTSKAPMDNVHMRRALSLAIDREVITDAGKAGALPAAMFTRPDMVAAPQQDNYADVMNLLADDATRNEMAQAELQAYLDETGLTVDQIPEITLVYNESETHALFAQLIQQMWSEVLGIDVQLASQEWATFLDLRENDPPQIFRAAWCFDYPDAHNWQYDVMRSDAGNGPDGGNELVWVNEEYDALLEQALATSDVEERRELYGQAEVILNWNDAVIAPIYFYGSTFLKSEGLEAPFSNTGIERFEKWTLP